MKRINNILLVSLAFFLLPVVGIASSLAKKEAKHRLMSCNIRVALDEDEANGVGWSTRKDVCIKIIKSYKPDVICFQEVLRVQDEDMRKAFPDYMAYGFEGPEMDKFKTGYHGIAKNTIMFSKKRYEFVTSGNYWLSETPIVAGSKSWGTARARHCNWVRIRDKKTNKEFRVLTVHLDHVSAEAKKEQTIVILDDSDQYEANFPQFLLGDFNSGKKSVPIKSIKERGWIDTYEEVNGEKEYGRTTHGFQGPNYVPKKKGAGRRIDFIFSKGPVRTLASSVITDAINGVYPSDHYFIYADVVIE